MRSYEEWTPEQDAILKRCAGEGMTIMRAAVMLNRSESSTRLRAKRMGLSFRFGTRITPAPDDAEWKARTVTFTHGACRGSVTADTPEAARAFRDALTRSLAFLAKRTGRAA